MVVEYMNDKIRISTKDYILHTNAKDYLVSENIKDLKEIFESSEVKFTNEQKQLLLNNAGGNKVYHNAENFNITKFKSNDMIIEFNPNKILNKSIYDEEPLNYNQIKDSFDIVETQLCGIGIETNLMKQNIKSYHNSFDIRLNDVYTKYEPVVKLATSEHKTIRQSNMQYIESSLYLGNKSQRICIYDKTIESNLTTNIMRLEHRFDKIPIEKRTSLRLLNDDKITAIRKKSKETIRKNFFIHLPKDVITKDDLLELFVYLFNEEYKNNKIMKYIVATVLSEQLQKYGIGIKDLLKSSFENRTRYERIIWFQKLIDEYKILPIDIKQRYDEMYNQFSKVV